MLMLIYAFAQLAGMGVYGVEAWSRRGDAFGVWFGLFATLSPLAPRARTGASCCARRSPAPARLRPVRAPSRCS